MYSMQTGIDQGKRKCIKRWKGTESVNKGSPRSQLFYHPLWHDDCFCSFLLAPLYKSNNYCAYWLVGTIVSLPPLFINKKQKFKKKKKENTCQLFFFGGRSLKN